MTESRAAEREPDPTSERPARRGGAPEPDVLLDIPEVTVDELRLAVDGLDADLSLRARLANLLELDAGVRVHLTKLELDVTGVSAEALLKVRLEKLVQILDRALSTIDQNPQVIDALGRSAGAGIDDVNRAARRLTEGAPVVDQAGQQVGRVGAVADRRHVERGGEANRPTYPAAPGPAKPPRGPEQPRPAGTGAAQPGPGKPGAAQPGPGKPGAAQPGPEKAGPAQPAGGPAGGAAGGNRPGAGGRQPVGKAPERPGGPLGAAQLAEQAGETLRQAGRSVWEAIQGGMSQHREQRPDR